MTKSCVLEVVDALAQTLAHVSNLYLAAETAEGLRQAVLRGIAWLDEQDIMWHIVVLKSGFNMSNNDTCVFGRLTGLGFNATAKMFNLSLDECTHLGFYGDIVHGHEKFLTELWSAAARFQNSVSWTLYPCGEPTQIGSPQFVSIYT